MMFTQQPTDYIDVQIPYRARYKVSFEGSSEELKNTLLSLLEDLEANFIDNEEIIRLNPLEDRYELEAVLNEDLEFSLLIYWSNDTPKTIEVTFDLDSPAPIEIPIDDQFLNPAKIYFPNMRLIYNFLERPKVTIHKSENRLNVLKNQQWIKTHRQEYKGRWVALRDGELLADTNSVDELLQQISSPENTLLTVIF
jgi:hypothetical protein